MMFENSCGIDKQGFKIHVSFGTSDDISSVFNIFNFLFECGVSFKCVLSINDLIKLNEGVGGWRQIGKAITVYTNSKEQALSLMKELDVIVPYSRGPWVQNEKKIRSGGAVSIRYGAFQSSQELDQFGVPTNIRY